MTKHIIMVEGFPVKVYVNAANTQAYVFPLFGKYYGLASDINVMDFVTTFLLAKNVNNVISFQSYLTQGEDTAIINIAA